VAIFSVVLPDGGVLDELPETRRHPVGDVGLPSPVVYRHSGGEGQPGLEVTLEVWKGVPVCTEVKLSAKADEKVHVRAKDIKLVAAQLENLIEDWMSFAAYEPGGSAAPGRAQWKRAWPPKEVERRAARQVVRSARKEVRRKMTDDHLQTVADTYQAAGSARTEAVARAFAVSYRTAQRYIEKAREAGLIG
jgi:hypothetical protein